LKQWCVGAAACNYNSLIAALTTQLSASGCPIMSSSWYLGLPHQSKSRSISKICAQNYVKFEDITGHGKIFDKEFFDGGTYWNEERERVTSSNIVKESLSVDPAVENIEIT